MNRRHFLAATGALTASTVFPRFAIGKPGPSANSKINVAFIGSGGWIAQQPYNQGCKDENLVAFCDVDRSHSAENMKNWRTSQPFFDDYRVMLEKQKGLWTASMGLVIRNGMYYSITGASMQART